MKKCPFCSEEIQNEAIVCKHCGKELNSQKVKAVNYWTPGKIGCASIFALFVISIIVASSSDSQNSTTSNSQKSLNTSSTNVSTSISTNNDLEVGNEGYLRLPNISDPKQVICLGSTKADESKITKALIAGDFIGILEIPGAFCVGNGSKVKLIEKDFPLRRVRIIQGVNQVDSDKVGLSGWLPYEWVTKN